MIWRNSFWNLMGMVAPLLISLITMGWLAREIGSEKFGIFLIAFSVLGYASIFDAGLTRAVIRFIALNDNNKDSDSKIMGTATTTIFIVASLGSLILFYFSTTIVNFLNVSSDSYDDVIQSFKILSFVVLPTLLSMVWFAFPEGKQEFFKLSVYKVISGSFIAIFPLITVLYESSLTSAMVGFLIGRVIAAFISFIPIFIAFRFSFFGFDMKTLKNLFNFGGWITLSNIISPIMVYSDRFILSNYLGANQVAFYAAPGEVITRMGVVPAAVARTLFPLFSNSNSDSLKHAKKAYFGMNIILLVMITPIFLLSEWLLNVWLGSEFGAEASLILRILLIGFFFNALAQIPFARIQAFGKSKITAVIHIIEIIPYLIILLFLVKSYGLAGAAVAWSLRALVDYILLVWFSRQLSSQNTTQSFI